MRVGFPVAEAELEDLPRASHTEKFPDQLEPREDDFSPASQSVTAWSFQMKSIWGRC